MTANEFLELAEKELIAAVEEAGKARLDRDAAQERLDLANKLAQSWAAIVEEKRKAAGVEREHGGGLRAAEIAEGMLRSSDDDGSMNLTQIVRDLLRSAGFRGLAPGEIRARAQHLYGATAANFPHGILGKLKAGGEVKNVHGRYVSIEFLGGPNENS
jgi:hypothetical protein